MSQHYRYLLFLAWFSFVSVTQILLFTNGFLLTRTTQSRNASCLTSKSEPTNQICSEANGTKVVLLIVDALRYDFAVFDQSLTDPPPYRNRLGAVRDLLAANGETSRLFRFVADPPTTTMQRLKALTTGSLPTFIDAGSNFATHEIDEDNLIDQLVKNDKKVIFMGDDTWEGLYPGRFHRSYPFPSFDVWDLDTVDAGVASVIFDEMRRDDWDVIVAHFLGVDHCGHRHGPSHPEMARKLSEVNDVIRKVVDAMDDDTLLFVVGDHGMTATGDHGGETENEVSAALFVHTKGKPLGRPTTFNNATIKQVDLVPTLAVALGVPIPFSNLGFVAFDALPTLPAQTARTSAWSNGAQIAEYLKEYSRTSPGTFKNEDLEKVFAEFDEVYKESGEVFAEGVEKFAKNARSLCETVWVKFDGFFMARALLLLSHCIIFVFLFLTNEKLEDNFTVSFNVSLLVGPLVGVAIGYGLYRAGTVSDLKNTVYFVSGLTAQLPVLYKVVKNFGDVAEKLHFANKSRSFTDIVSRIVVTFSSVMLVTNSFILQENKATLFLLVTILLGISLEFAKVKLKTGNKRKVIFATIAVLFLLRFTVYFWRCREEQPCQDYFPAKNSNSPRSDWLLAAVSLGLFVSLTRSWLRSCGNLNGFSPAVIFAKFSPTICTVCSVGFWVLHKLPENTKLKLIGPWQTDGLAWVVYLLTFLGIFVSTLKPLCIYRFKEDKIEVNRFADNFIPELAKHVAANRDNKTPQVPLIYGLATAYSSSFIVIVVNFALLYNLLLGDVLMPSCASLLVILGIFLVTTSILRFEKATKLENLCETPSILTIFWFVFSIYSFYATGHQPTFTNIVWESAFVGSGGFLDYKVVPTVLVTVNTFGSYFLLGFCLPLLVIAPFTVHLMLPTLFNKNPNIDLSRGDLTIYDNDNLIFKNLFKTSTIYLLCHALRVFFVMLAATIHCRHLMVWNIFAPKLIFEFLGFFVTLAGVGLGYAYFGRVNGQVDELMKKLNKEN